MTRREMLTAGAAMMVAPTPAGAEPAGDPPDLDEIIRVAPDRWTFVGRRSGRRFVPFGSNLVLTSKDDLDCFGPRYSDERMRPILDAAARQGVNTLKVFLPIHTVLPDPQQAGEAAPSASHLDNLDRFLDLCRPRGIRVVISFTEWGGYGCKWWQEGGQYFGRRPWRKDEGPDSLGVLIPFWLALGRRLYANPTIFSYTPVVELTMPSGNLTPPWAPPEDRIGIVEGEIARWYWQRWAVARHGSLDAVNRAWGTRYGSPDAIPVVTYAYDGAKRAYAEPEAMVLDYQGFREWACERWLRPQVEAVRAADPTHMVTISDHMRSWNLWEGAARHFLGYTPAEQSRHVDYLTHHANYDENEIKRGGSVEGIVAEVRTMVRFARAGLPMPVVIEEYTFGSPDPRRTAEVQGAIVRGTMGHASGWINWYLQYPEGANVADAAFPSAWLTDDLRPTAWGETALGLSRELRTAHLRRVRALRTVTLDRAKELVPKQLSTLITHFRDKGEKDLPTDYHIPHDRCVEVRLPDDPDRRVPKLRCVPAISGCLIPYDPSLSVEAVSGWKRELADQRALGFDLIWLSHLQPALASDEASRHMTRLLDLCAANGMRAILDVGSTPDWYGRLDADDEIARIEGWAQAIGKRFGRHPAFWGWYLPHEIYVVWDRMGDYMDRVFPAAAKLCRAAAPGKPVTVSPFFILDRDKVFGDFRWAEPDEWRRYWARLMKRSGMDIVMLQDSGEHFSYVTTAQRRPWFAAARQACSAAGAELWGNVETAEFECPSIDEYVKRYGRVHHSTVRKAPWRAVPVDRLESKLRLAAEFSERIVTWGYWQFGRPSLGAAAAKWHGELARYQRTVRERGRR